MIPYRRIARSWEDRSMRVAPPVSVSDEERQQLERYERGRSTPARLVLRARIVLLAAEGKQNCDIAAAAGTDRFTVARWRNRFIRLPPSAPRHRKGCPASRAPSPLHPRDGAGNRPQDN